MDKSLLCSIQEDSPFLHQNIYILFLNIQMLNIQKYLFLYDQPIKQSLKLQ